MPEGDCPSFSCNCMIISFSVINAVFAYHIFCVTAFACTSHSCCCCGILALILSFFLLDSFHLTKLMFVTSKFLCINLKHF